MIGLWQTILLDFWGQARVGSRRFVDVTGLGCPPLEYNMSQSRGVPLRADRASGADRYLGNLVGATGWFLNQLVLYRTLLV